VRRVAPIRFFILFFNKSSSEINKQHLKQSFMLLSSDIVLIVVWVVFGITFRNKRITVYSKPKHSLKLLSL